jgi:hypothetical protein
MRSESACTRARTRDRRMRTADASFARSFGPRVSILTMHGARKCSRGGAVGFGITVGQTHASGRNQHWGRTNGHSVARRASPLSQERGVRRQERKEVEAFVLRGSRAQVRARTVVFQLQKSEGDLWPRISSAHALRKGRSGSSERGPSSERRSAGETVGRCLGRKVGCVSSSLAKRG